MAVAIQAEEILEKARTGQAVTSDERRLGIVYIQGHNPGTTQQTLADTFGVSATQIRKDLEKIKKSALDVTKSTYVESAVADLIHEQQVIYNGIRTSCEASKNGTDTRLRHLQAMHKVRLDTIRILQEIGALPKNLSETTVKKEEFRAEMQPNTNQIVVRPVELFDDFEEGESLEDKLKRQGHLEILEREFAGSTTVPAPTNTDGQNNNQEESN